MSPARLFFWLVGIVLVIASLVMFFFLTDLDTIIPTTFLILGLVLFVGLAIMSFASRDRDESHQTVVERHH